MSPFNLVTGLCVCDAVSVCKHCFVFSFMKSHIANLDSVECIGMMKLHWFLRILHFSTKLYQNPTFQLKSTACIIEFSSRIKILWIIVSFCKCCMVISKINGLLLEVNFFNKTLSLDIWSFLFNFLSVKKFCKKKVRLPWLFTFKHWTEWCFNKVEHIKIYILNLLLMKSIYSVASRTPFMRDRALIRLQTRILLKSAVTKLYENT